MAGLATGQGLPVIGHRSHRGSAHLAAVPAVGPPRLQQLRTAGDQDLVRRLPLSALRAGQHPAEARPGALQTQGIRGVLAGQLARLQALASLDRGVRIGRPAVRVHVAHQVAQCDHLVVVGRKVGDEARKQARIGVAPGVVIRHAVEGEHGHLSATCRCRGGTQVGKIPGRAVHPRGGYQQRMVDSRLVGAPEGAVDVVGPLRIDPPAGEPVPLGGQCFHRGQVVMAARIPVGSRHVDTVGDAAPLHLLQVADELLPRLRGHVHVVAVVVADLEAGVVQPLDLAPVHVAFLVGELQPLRDEERGPEPVAAQQRGDERGIGLLAVVERENNQALRSRLHGTSGPILSATTPRWSRPRGRTRSAPSADGLQPEVASRSPETPSGSRLQSSTDRPSMPSKCRTLQVASVSS